MPTNLVDLGKIRGVIFRRLIQRGKWQHMLTQDGKRAQKNRLPIAEQAVYAPTSDTLYESVKRRNQLQKESVEAIRGGPGRRL